MNPKDVLLIRAEIAMWGCLATAGPWLIAGNNLVGLFFTVLAGAAWFVGKVYGGAR